MEKPTPKVNSVLREKYVSKTVRLIGKIVSVKKA
jgi:replication factor A3